MDSRGISYQIFKDRVAEELGDIFWYVANIASKEELDLETIANYNLKKAKNRWLPPTVRTPDRIKLFDEAFPAGEQFPKSFESNLARSVRRMALRFMTLDGLHSETN